MAFINWDDSLSVKINSIDDQHKKLVAMINEFYDSIINRTSNEGLLKLISEMKNYTVVHFSHEEKLMKQLNYPDFVEHKKEHDLFVAKVLDVEEKTKSGKLVVSIEITTFLKDWLKSHINGTDKKYTSFFLQNQVK